MWGHGYCYGHHGSVGRVVRAAVYPGLGGGWRKRSSRRFAVGAKAVARRAGDGDGGLGGAGGDGGTFGDAVQLQRRWVEAGERVVFARRDVRRAVFVEYAGGGGA